MFCTVNKFSISDATFDLGNGFDPAEGLGVVVPMGEPANDRLLQTLDAVEAAPADGLAGDQCEPTLDQVEPRAAGRSEV